MGDAAGPVGPAGCPGERTPEALGVEELEAAQGPQPGAGLAQRGRCGQSGWVTARSGGCRCTQSY